MGQGHESGSLRPRLIAAEASVRGRALAAGRGNSKPAQSLKKDLNKQRGSKDVPSQKLGNQLVSVIPIEDFANPNDFYFQKFFNGLSEVVMTDDDQFLESPDGVLFDPELIGMTFYFAFASLINTGNRIEGTFWIQESDAYLRSDFFDSPKEIYAVLLAGLFRQTLGYPPDLWTNDFVGQRRHYVTRENFNNKRSEVWEQVKHRGRYWYGDAIDMTDDVLMIPLPKTVLDIGGDEVLPDRDTIALNRPTAPLVVITNLKGLQKTMSVKISRIDLDENNREREISITTLKSKTRDWPMDTPGIGQWFPTVFLSQVALNRKKELDKLKDALRQHGKMMTIAGQTWQRALEVSIKATGRLGESGSTRSVKQRYYIINSDEEPQGTN